MSLTHANPRGKLEHSKMNKLSEQDKPGASLCGRDPKILKIPELKQWFKCRAAVCAVQVMASSWADNVIDPDNTIAYAAGDEMQITLYPVHA